MNIQEDYVSFETAKLLKEKGFNPIECGVYYSITTGKRTTELLTSLIACPTQSIAMKWLREVHNIMVSPYALSLGYYFEIFDLTNRDITGCEPLYKVGIPNKEDVLSSYEQACEEAIKYCLEHLI